MHMDEPLIQLMFMLESYSYSLLRGMASLASSVGIVHTRVMWESGDKGYITDRVGIVLTAGGGTASAAIRDKLGGGTASATTRDILYH
jgi:hypothetical protein